MIITQRDLLWNVSAQFNNDEDICIIYLSLTPVGSFNQATSDQIIGFDEEMGYEIRAEQVGPYQYVWPDGEDYYSGIKPDGDKTDIPLTNINKVGGNPVTMDDDD